MTSKFACGLRTSSGLVKVHSEITDRRWTLEGSGALSVRELPANWHAHVLIETEILSPAALSGLQFTLSGVDSSGTPRAWTSGLGAIAHSWVPLDGNVPTGALLSGSERDGQTPLYICRYRDGDRRLPGKLIPSLSGGSLTSCLAAYQSDSYRSEGLRAVPEQQSFGSIS